MRSVAFLLLATAGHLFGLHVKHGGHMAICLDCMSNMVATWPFVWIACQTWWTHGHLFGLHVKHGGQAETQTEPQTEKHSEGGKEYSRRLHTVWAGSRTGNFPLSIVCE